MELKKFDKKKKRVWLALFTDDENASVVLDKNGNVDVYEDAETKEDFNLYVQIKCGGIPVNLNLCRLSKTYDFGTIEDKDFVPNGDYVSIYSGTFVSKCKEILLKNSDKELSADDWGKLLKDGLKKLKISVKVTEHKEADENVCVQGWELADNKWMASTKAKEAKRKWWTYELNLK